MPEAREDYWPSEIPDPADPAPVAILKEQAELLADKTRGEIEGVVRMYLEEGTVYHTLFLKANPIGDYLYRVLTISYPAFDKSRDVYPITAEGSPDASPNVGAEVKIANDEEFRRWLRDQLSSDHVRNVIGLLKRYIREIQEVRAAQIG